MATDIEAVERNLRSFYDFQDKAVVHVGAGGGQLIGYSEITRSVLAVDIDKSAISRLDASVQEKGLSNKFKIQVADILSIYTEADVVLFEFCLHEMSDPGKALKHARSLAPNILVIDHHPDSQWAWYVLENEKASRSWDATRKLNVIQEESFNAEQYFSNYSDLLAKVKVMGDLAIARISDFIGKCNITIEMKYTIALLK
jgi:2-polyprenyl-3-methyl-5-hydroxy-6-metoxy-1,4-benzoquinol methylase